jgi:hypothetical protein
MMLGVVCVLVVGFSRVTTMRPELFGGLCFAVLLWLLTRAEPRPAPDDAASAPAAPPRSAVWTLWLAVPLVMCLWTNLHGSYLCGLVLLGCYALGKLIDVAWSQRSVWAALCDGGVQRAAFLCELGLLATLINPYGLDLLVYNLTFARSPNLASIAEWMPLVILGVGGREFALSLVALLFVWRHSKLRVSATQVLALAAFGLLSVKSVRMIGWYAPVFAWAIAPHLGNILWRWWPASLKPLAAPTTSLPEGTLPAGRSFQFTLACGLVVWLAVVFSPLGSLVLGSKSDGQALNPRQYDRGSSPIGVVNHFKSRPPLGQAYQPQHWGDWLQRNVPEFQPFVTSNIHLAPRKVWEDYERITYAMPGWQDVLDRYHVTTLVLDKNWIAQSALVAAMSNIVKRNSDWALAYEDEQAVIYVRTVARAVTPAAPEQPKEKEPANSDQEPSSS